MENSKLVAPWIERYIKFIKGGCERKHNEAYKWLAFDHYKKNWKDDHNGESILALLRTAFGQCKNLLAGGHYLPLKMICVFAENDGETVSDMFKYLYNEGIPLLDRLKFFEKRSALLLEKHHSGANLNHYQSDRAMMVYLAMRYPEKYYLYKNKMYNDFCFKTGLAERPGRGWNGEFTIIEKYNKLCDKVKEVLLSSDSLLVAYHHFYSQLNVSSNDNYNLLTQDFIYFAAEIFEKREENYWVFQGNPKEFDIERGLREGLTNSWKVTAHKDEVKDGDKIILYITGTDAGCYALGEVTSGVYESKSQKDDFLWKKGHKAEFAVDIEFTHNLVDSPIYKNTLKSSKKLDKLKIGNQGTNFTATKYEYDTVLEMINKNTTGNKYWLYAPGEKGSMWKEFYNEGIMGIGWDFLGDLRNYKSKDSIQSALKQHHETDKSKKNDTVTNNDFINKLSIGDIVIVKAGIHKLLGYGTVCSDYIFDPERGNYKSIRKVDWQKSGEWSIDNNLALKTLTDITACKSDKPEFERYYDELLELMNDDTRKHKFPLNQILYGPPGTGKTYSTIKKAVAIIEDVKEKDLEGDYSVLKRRYDKYCDEGQIVFTTFHQSMCYEDFIEGIKPHTTEEDKVTYKIEDGLFMRMCTKASFSMLEKKATSTSSILDFSIAFDNYKQKIEERLESNEENIGIVTKNGGQILIEGISSQGNFILKHTDRNNVYTASKERLSKLNSAFPDLSLVTGIDREFRTVIGGSNSTANWALLNAIRNDKEVWQYEVVENSTFGEEDMKDAISNVDFKEQNTEGKPYIIIIDEINRGNVSQIFGELITLLEENKRLGNPEQLEVTLPYSKKKFGVPNNLHIIGTMNTADRSVEALDTALRRRFQFVEMAPNPTIIETVNKTREVEGIDLIKLLETINERIEILLDRDHLIGHSYFLSITKLEDLKVTFSKQIMPLLQEYFYGDYGKIALVLGEGFCHGKKIDNSAKIFAKVDNYETDSFDDQVTYTLVNPLTMKDDVFMLALETLLPAKGE